MTIENAEVNGKLIPGWEDDLGKDNPVRSLNAVKHYAIRRRNGTLPFIAVARDRTEAMNNFYAALNPEPEPEGWIVTEITERVADRLIDVDGQDAAAVAEVLGCLP